MDIDNHLHHTYMITIDDDTEKHAKYIIDTTEIFSTKGSAFVLKDLERFVLEDA